MVLMGVSGSGKSSVGAELSRLTGIPYLDGDDLHPAENVAKMRDGIPLSDRDRLPWLRKCGATLGAAPDGLILGCSALRRTYRDLLRDTSGKASLRFVLLDGSEALLRERMKSRSGHYMPAALLQSQLDTLEPPGVDENALRVDIDRPVRQIAEAILADGAEMAGNSAKKGAAR